MDQTANSTSLLEKVLQSTSSGKRIYQVNNLISLLSCSRISTGKQDEQPPRSKKEQFHLRFLGEIYRDLQFHYHRFRKNRPVDDTRLDNLLRSLACASRKIDSQVMEAFLHEISDDSECYWFLVSTYTNYLPVAPDIYLKKLADLLTRNNLLTADQKSALKYSKATSLFHSVKAVFDEVTPAIKLDLFKILTYRGESEADWVAAIHKDVAPLLNRLHAEIRSDKY